MRKSKTRKLERKNRAKAVVALKKELKAKRKKERSDLLEKYPGIFSEKEKFIPLKQLKQIIKERTANSVVSEEPIIAQELVPDSATLEEKN